MSDLRKLILGETWILPLGIAAIVAVAVLVEPSGFVLLGLVIALLVTACSAAPR